MGVFMMNYALIKNGIVENVVVWDGDGDIFSEYEVVEIDGVQAGIGWGYDNGEFIEPEVIPSQE